MAGHNISRAAFIPRAPRQARVWIVAALAILAVGGWLGVAPAQAPPYPRSTAILGITWDFANKLQRGPGSDLWPVTWAANDSLFMAYGDGGGANGTNDVCRTRFGLHSVAGSPPNFTFTNVWGCRADGTGCTGTLHDPVCDASFGGVVAASGVPGGLVAVGNTLYAVLWRDPPVANETRIVTSTDLGQSWSDTSVVFTHNAGEYTPSGFIQFGPGYSGRRDSYVYMPGGKLGDTTRLYLARAPLGSVGTFSTWQWFTGTPSAPAWGPWANAVPIHIDPNAVGDGGSTGGSIQYFPILRRYVMIHSAGTIQQMHVYDAPEPWGPWSTVYYSDTWGGYGATLAVAFTILPKHISADSTTFWMVFSGANTPVNWDNYNLIKGTFTLPAGRPSSPMGVQIR